MEEIVRTINRKGFDQEESEMQEQERPTPDKLQGFIENQVVEEKALKQVYGFLRNFLEDWLLKQQTEHTQSVLNIIYYFDSEDWQKTFSKFRTLFTEKLLDISANPYNKINLLRALGMLVSYDEFLTDKMFIQNLYKIISIHFKDKTLNIAIKNSWVVANFCANLEKVKNLEQTQVEEIYEMIVEYSLNPKEKILSNGYRALGLFLKNINQEFLKKLFIDAEDHNQRLKQLREIYMKALPETSPKV